MHADALPAIRRLMALRQTLVPFFHDLLHRDARDYAPVLRPLWLDHPEDAGAWVDGDDHMIGRDVLAAIVVDPGATMRRVRLPGQGQWYDVWTGAVLDGGAAQDVPAPLDGLPPLFARAGSGMLVDLTAGGFRAGAPELGVWLFPPVGAGAFAWEGHDDDGESAVAEPQVWRIEGVATAETVTLKVTSRGPGSSATAITIVLPVTETREISIEGGTVERQPGDRPTYRVTL